MKKKYFKKLIEWKYKKKEDKKDFNSLCWILSGLIFFTIPCFFSALANGFYNGNSMFDYVWYEKVGGLMGVSGLIGILITALILLSLIPRRKKYYIEVKKK